MTCVVAIKQFGMVYMGADSAASNGNGYAIRVRNDPKINQVGPFLFGFTTSFRMGQLLGHAFVAPERDPRVSTEKFMTTTFINAVRECLKSGGYAKKADDVESGGSFLVGYEGRIFRIESDYQVGETRLDYEAVGCGQDVAMGALYASFNSGNPVEPMRELRTALMAAEQFSCGVRGPFVYKAMTLDGTSKVVENEDCLTRIPTDPALLPADRSQKEHA